MPNLYIMGCICHLINLAAEKGSACLPINIDENVVDIFYYLEKSAKRKEKLKLFQQLYNTEIQKILKHICTRWLSLGVCLSRIIDQWTPLLMFFKEEVKSVSSSTKINSSIENYKIPKVNKKLATASAANSATNIVALSVNNKQKAEVQSSQTTKIARIEPKIPKKIPAGKSLSREERIFMFLSSDLNKAFCMFMCFVLPSFDIPNVLLQSRIPKIHILHTVFKDFFRDILLKFIKPSVMSSNTIYNVNYSSRENQKSDEDLVIGTATSRVVNELSEEDKKLFYSHIRKYFCRVCDYFLHKFPIKDELIFHAKVANICSLSDASFSSVKFFIQKYPALINLLFQSDIDAATDKLQSQFCGLQLENLNEIKKLERPDSQWSCISKLKNAEGICKYYELSKFMLAILTIPHSNAECERVFSIVTKTKTKFRPSISNEMLEKLLLAKTCMAGNCYEQSFSEDFLKKAKSATSTNNNSC